VLAARKARRSRNRGRPREQRWSTRSQRPRATTDVQASVFLLWQSHAIYDQSGRRGLRQARIDLRQHGDIDIGGASPPLAGTGADCESLAGSSFPRAWQLAIGRRLDLEAAIAGPAAEGGK